MVSYDTNCNGIPDDEWYELAGSEYYSPLTKHSYSLTYFRPDPNRQIVEDEDNSLDDVYYIRWVDNNGIEGYMAKNIFHNQEYFPKWINVSEITFNGSLLANNGEDISGYGAYYVLNNVSSMKIIKRESSDYHTRVLSLSSVSLETGNKPLSHQ